MLRRVFWAALNWGEEREFEYDAPVAVFAHAFDDVWFGGVRFAADGDFGPISVRARGQLLRAVGQGEVGGRNHLFGGNFPTRDGAGTLRAFGQVPARVDPKQLVREARRAWIAMDTLHAIHEFLHDAFGTRVFGFRFATGLRETERKQPGGEPDPEGALRALAHG
jgi:hypothetical protein